MSNQVINKEKLSNCCSDELILVVKREIILPNGSFIGIDRSDIAHYQEMVRLHGEFQWRSVMEQDRHYKQIIPYLIFNYQDRFFLMQRKATASEVRLQSKYSLGIGGHIRQEDLQGNSIFEWALREFHEEVSYDGTLHIKPLGILNDDRDSVGQVHLGFVLLLRGDSENISIKAEHKHGFLVTAQEADQFVGRMESWSQIVWNVLRETT